MSDDLHKNELIQQIGLLIDQQIIGNYQIQKSNLIAYDLLSKNTVKSGDYSLGDKEEFAADIEQKIAKMAGDPAELRSIFLNMYARPYQSKLDLQRVKNN